MSKSTKSARPRKPRPDFPLFPHATKRWAKKIRGKLHYFGAWDDPDGALRKYCDQADDLHAGRTPRVQKDGLTLRDLVNQFLSAKKLAVAAGEMKPRSWRDLYVTCERLLQVFGKTRLAADVGPDDFQLFKTKLVENGNRPITVGNEVRRVRGVFNWAFEFDLLQQEVRFGPGFKLPSKKTVRLERAKKGSRMFEADELRRIIDAAPIPMKAMALLGINAGLGNTDLADLQTNHLELKTGWMNYPRPKTGIKRRCLLWPETLEAVAAAIAGRPAAAAADVDGGCVFLTVRGQRCVRIHGQGERAGTKCDMVTREFGSLLSTLQIKRPGLNFYALRHTFETIAGDGRDQVAVDAIMGHADQSMAADYRERIDDGRLRAVADFVRSWLWPKGK